MYDPETLPELVKYVRTRRDAVQSEIDLASSYGGPDPNAKKTAENHAIVETLNAVLVALRDIETQKTKKRLTETLGL
jgi:hypothetical protein